MDNNEIQEQENLRRKSAPKPTADDYLADARMQQANKNNGVVDGFRALQSPIGVEVIHKATQILQKYKEGKANLEKRIIDNEQWYKLRHWECMRKNEEQVQPTSAWLFNCIANKHADAMDNFPAPNVLPREEGDKAEAEMLSSILPVVLAQNDFEKTYDDVWTYKLKTGTGVYGVFWDATKLNGLGDISIQKVDIINLFWESGITDIQKSRNLFHVDLMDNDVLTSLYPQLQGKLGTQTIDVAKYVYDDSVDTSNKSVVVDWYYKKTNSQGKTVLHYCKYCNDVVLFATENDTMPHTDNYGNVISMPMADTGFYDHAKYPFVFDPLFKVEGTPAGFGYIDVGKSAQEFIDRGNQAIMRNMLANASPRVFVSNNGGVNEEEYADLGKDIVHYDGTPEGIIPVQVKPLNDVYVNVILNKIEELKETTGNRDVSTGGTSSGVTAASAIAAMQEAGSKLSRDANKASYRVFREICLFCIELIRQFYDLPRCFRIMGQNGAVKFINYSNANIKPQEQGDIFGQDMGLRIPLFDIEITAQKQSPYSKMAQNELALQFYQAGFFNPNLADQALACIDMMDFDRKDFVSQKIMQNGGMIRQMMTLAQMIDGGSGPISQSIAQQYGVSMPGANVAENENLGGEKQEKAVVKNARERVADSTSPQ